MSKKVFRYFGGFIDKQQKWLNSMSSKGYRLVNTSKLIFEFEKCEPNKYQYYIDFVAHKSNSGMKEYKRFLEDFGYTVMTKNININYSIRKIRFRPYGDRFGKISTSPGNFNKELLIVEKINDGKPFELHTSVEDKISYYTYQRNAYFTSTLLWLFCVVLYHLKTKTFGFGTIAFLLLVVLYFMSLCKYQNQIAKLRKDSITNE